MENWKFVSDLYASTDLEGARAAFKAKLRAHQVEGFARGEVDFACLQNARPFSSSIGRRRG